MKECKHEIENLLGTADGVLCRSCGKIFHSFEEINPPSPEAPPEATEKPKRGKKKSPEV